MEIKIFTDGGARGNPGPAAVGVVIKKSKSSPREFSTRSKNQKSKIIEEETIAKFGKKIGVTTNNIAEYQAVIEALTWIKENLPAPSLQSSRLLSPGGEATGGQAIVSFFLDSRLVVSQLNGIFKVKNPGLRELLFKIRQLEAEVGGSIFYNLISREENFLADKEVNLALGQKI